MAEVISNPHAGMKRRLPVWMLQAKSENGGRNTENGNKTGRKSETLRDNQDEVKPAIRKNKRRMPETEDPGESGILRKCRTKQRNNDLQAKDESRNKVVACNAENDGDSRMDNRRAPKTKRKLKSMTREMEMETSSPGKSDDEVDLSVEDLMSIAEEYVNADKEKQCKSSTAKEPNPEAHSSSLSVSSNTNIERLVQDAASSKALSKCSVIKSSSYFTGSQTSEVKNPVDELCSANTKATGDPARDMLDLFLGPLLRESSVKEQKNEAVETLSRLTTYEINKRDASREVQRGAEPATKKKSSLKDKVALFLGVQLWKVIWKRVDESARDLRIYYLEEIAYVANERIGLRCDGDPLGILHQVQPADVILMQDGEEVAVGVRHQAEGFRREGARGVPVEAEEARSVVAVRGEAVAGVA